MKTRILLLVIVAAAAAGGYYVYRHEDVQRAERPGQIRVSGNIEATEVQIAFKIPGRVEQRRFDEGQIVKQRDKVALLDTADLHRMNRHRNRRGAKNRESQQASTRHERGAEAQELKPALWMSALFDQCGGV